MGLGKNCRMSTVLRQSWTPLVPALPNILPREKVTDAFLLPFPDDFFTSFFSPAGQHSPSPSSSSPSQVAHCTPLLCSALLSSPQRSTLFKTCDIFLQGGMGLLISSVSQSATATRARMLLLGRLRVTATDGGGGGGERARLGKVGGGGGDSFRGLANLRQVIL